MTEKWRKSRKKSMYQQIIANLIYMSDICKNTNFSLYSVMYYSSFIFVQGRVDSETSDYSDSSGMTEYNRGARNKNNFLTFEF